MTTTLNVYGQGPLKLTGPATIIDTEGNEFVLDADKAVTLCRCGHSSNKPFCDTTHKTIGWNEPAPIDVERLPGNVRPAG